MALYEGSAGSSVGLWSVCNGMLYSLYLYNII